MELCIKIMWHTCEFMCLQINKYNQDLYNKWKIDFSDLHLKGIQISDNANCCPNNITVVHKETWRLMYKIEWHFVD